MVFRHRLSQFLHFIRINPPLTKCNAFQTCYFQPLTFLNHFDKGTCFTQRVVRTCVQPSKATPQSLYFQLFFFQKILILFTGNNYPEATQNEFYQWLVDEDHASQKEDALRELWNKAQRQKNVKGMQKSYERLKKQEGIPTVPKERRIRPIHIWQSAAAILFLLLASSVYLSTVGTKAETDLLQQYIPIAEMRSLTLPDGTKVQLNSKSTLLYPQEFTGDSRSVFLLGEANFKVKPDKKRPFIVKSNDLQITALGTEFNVSAYPESQEIATTLISGSIRVDYNNLTTSVILHPNEQFAYNRNNKKYDLSNPDMDDVTAWQRGELVLQKMTLTDIINVLERKYPYAFVYSIKNLKNDRFSFRFKDNAPLEEVMEIIVNVVGQMDYRIVEDKCYLTRI